MKHITSTSMSNTNIFLVSIISSLCLYSSLTHGMELRPRNRPLRFPTFAAFKKQLTRTENAIKRHAEKVKNRTPHQQLIGWVKLWQKYRFVVETEAGPEIFRHIELLLCKYPSLSLAHPGITKEQFALTEHDGFDVLTYACEANAPFLAQQLIESGMRCYGNDFESHRPLSKAAFKGNTRMVFMFLQAGAQPYTGPSGPIDNASIYNKPEALRILLHNIVQRNNHQPLTFALPHAAENGLAINARTMEEVRAKNNPTILRLLDCATTPEPHKRAKLGYPVAVLPAQLPHILMMRERGVKYTGDRIRQVATMRENNLRQTGDRMGQAKRPRKNNQEEPRKKIA